MGVLRFDGVNDVVTIPTTMVCNTGTSSWVWEFRIAISSYPASGNRYFTGAPTGTTNSGLCLRQASGDGALALVVGGTNIAAFTSALGYILDDGSLHTYRVERDAGADVRFYRDGSLFDTVSWVTGTIFSLSVGRFGSGSASASGITAFDLEYFDFVSGFSNLEKWDANLSGGTGSVLPTVSGTNQGALVNFPTDNSQWIGFASAVTSTISYDIGDFGFSASASVTDPAVTTSVNYDLGSFGFDVSASNSVPLVSADIAYSIGDFGFDVVADNLAPSGGATVNFSIGDFGFAVDSNSSVPVVSADAVFDLGGFGFAVVASIASNDESASVAFDIGSFGLAASASVINPPINATTAFDMGSFGFSVFATQPSEAAPQDGASITFTEKSRTISFVELSRTIRFVEGSRTIKF